MLTASQPTVVSRAESLESRDLVGGRARLLAVLVSGCAEVPLLRFAQFTPMKIGDREMGFFRSSKIVQVGRFSLTPALSRWERG